MFTPQALVALAAAPTLFSSLVSGHMIMATPKPFGNPDNSPLSSSGANFPCKSTGSASFYSGVSNPPMPAGSTQTLSFTGSAIHGGGSCQVALTKDKAPTASSSWQVILSIEGGCPGVDSPSTFKYQIPSSMAAGDYVLAWTWISKLAGQPEYYMNCAPITVTGGGKKRSTLEEDDEEEDFLSANLTQRADTSFPELFVANLQSINSCKTTPSTDPQFPNPGPNVQQPNKAATYAKVQGSNCVPKGATDTGGSSGGGSGGSTGGASSAAGGSTPVATSAAGGDGSGSGSGSPSSAASGSAPTSDSGSGSGTGSSPASSAAGGDGAAPTSSVVATPISVPSAASSAPAAASPSTPAGTGSAPPSSSGTTTGSSAGAMTGPCTNEGAWNCIGGTSFQRCASGSWSATIPMAGGTSCAPGQSMDLAAAAAPAHKRDYVKPRFPGLRRHAEIVRNLGGA